VLTRSCNSYWVCEKTDGIRCLLYCTLDEDKSEIHYLIDRHNNYYFVERLHLPHHDDRELRKFHSGTLIDGELVNDHEDGKVKLRYLAFDLLALDEKSIMARPYSKRWAVLNEHVIAPYREVGRRWPEDFANMPFEVKIKNIQKPYGTVMMFKDVLPGLPHGNDGLIFQCIETAYVSGTDQHILKWKPPHENTIDFLLKLGDFPVINPGDGDESFPDYDAKPTFNLYVHAGEGVYEEFSPLYITDEEWEAMKAMDEILDLRVVECYKDESGRWRYKRDGEGPVFRPRFRDDKPDANHKSTVHKVLEAINDGVTQADLENSAGSVKAAWKKRHPEEQAPPPPRR
jgi:mRNA guanylyltransferase